MSAWPTPDDFALVLQNPRIAFRDPQLQQLTIQKRKDARGNDVLWPRAGAFACVYKGTRPNREDLAVRVFLTPSVERRERYAAVYQYLKNRRLLSLVGFEYDDRGVRSPHDGQWYPLLTMDWVDGDTLYQWVREKCLGNDARAVDKLSERWTDTIQELADNKVAHGDLQHGNVMITGAGKLKLVDYDCMCVPPLIGRRNLEIGVDPYQHPDRNKNTLLSPYLDNFSASFIFVALRALAVSPGLWYEYVEKHNYDKLLFRREDLDAPQQSALMQTLRRYPEVHALCQQLLEQMRLPLDQVQPLGVFSWEKVKVLLSQWLLDEAVDLVTRNQKKFSEGPPPLPGQLQQAQHCIDQRKQLEAARDRGDEAKMANTYKPGGPLDKYPRAQPVVAVAKDAHRVLPRLDELQQAISAQAWRKLVSTWDSHKNLLAGRKSAEKFAPTVDTWRPRNQACDEFLRLLQRQPPAKPADVEAAWEGLERLGPPPHPDAEPHRADMQQRSRRRQAWEKFCQAPQELGETADLQVLRAWNEALFAGWDEAEGHRPRFEDAKTRLEKLKQLEAQIAQGSPAPSLEVELAIFHVAKELPPQYVYKSAGRVEQTRQRLRALLQLLAALKEPAWDLAIWERLQALEKVQGRPLVPPEHLPRIDKAKQRCPKLAELKQIPATYPPSDAPKYDPKLLKQWDENLLADCRDAKPWRDAAAAARLRQGLLAELKRAFDQGDKPKAVELSAEPCLDGYPLPDQWRHWIARAREEVEATRRLLVVLNDGDPARFDVQTFLEAFDARVVRGNPQAFAPHQARLSELAAAHLRPAKNLKLEKPRGVKALVRQSHDTAVCRVRWTWPRPKFNEECVLAVCPRRPNKEEGPHDPQPSFELWVNRRTYEEGVYLPDHWPGEYVVVWAVVDLGFAKIFSEPVELGRLES